MEIQIEETCPQCGGSVILSEADRLLICPYCGVRILLQSQGVFRFVLPQKEGRDVDIESIIYAPYLRLKGYMYFVSESGITHRAIDTTQAGSNLTCLPPSLGLRPQAMKLKRLTEKTGGSYLKLSLPAQAILKKAIQLGELMGMAEGRMLHRAFIGETISFIYLPLLKERHGMIDGVNGLSIIRGDEYPSGFMETIRFNSRWHISTDAAICPKCGWDLEGEGNSRALICSSCDTAWEVGDKGIKQTEYHLGSGNGDNSLYLPFWKLSVRIPVLGINTFADFIVRTNQPMLPRRSWQHLEMSFWIPGFKLRPKVFLQAAKQMTLAQTNLETSEGRFIKNTFPVTLSSLEARRAIKVCLAASTASKKKILELLPQVRLKDVQSTLVYLPFIDKSHDWQHISSGTVIPKRILRFGRSM